MSETTKPSRAAKRLAIAVMCLYLTALFVAVLLPMPVEPGVEPDPEPTLVYGWLADALRNLLLMAPLGAALALNRWRIRGAAAVGFGLSVAIELAQLAIPGRFASPVDVVTNTLSCTAGAALVQSARFWLAPRRELARRLSLAASGSAIALSFACVWLLGPALPNTPWFGGWTLDLAGFAQYRGRILEARVGEVPIGAFGPARDGDALRRALANESTISIRAIAGPPPPSLAPLVTIHDASELVILLIGADEQDFVLRWRTRAAAIGLDNPSYRIRDALATVDPGDRLALRVSAGPDFRTLQVDDGPGLPLAWTPGHTWALFVGFLDHFPALERLLDGLWGGLLILPACYWARRDPLCWIAIGGYAASFGLLPRIGPLGPSPAHEWLGLAVAVVTAPWLARRLGRASARD